MANSRTDELELEAAIERAALHESIRELKTRVRETLDVKKNVRRHIVFDGTFAAILGLAFGYGVCGLALRIGKVLK